MDDTEPPKRPKQPKNRKPKKNRYSMRTTPQSKDTQDVPNKQLSRTQSFMSKFRRNKSLTHAEETSIIQEPESPVILPYRSPKVKRSKKTLSALRRKRKSTSKATEPIETDTKSTINSPRRSSKPSKQSKKLVSSVSAPNGVAVLKKPEKGMENLDFHGLESDTSLIMDPVSPRGKKSAAKYHLPLEDLTKSIPKSPRLSDRAHMIRSSKPVQFIQSLTSREQNGTESYEKLSSDEKLIECSINSYTEGNYLQAQANLKKIVGKYLSRKNKSKFTQTALFLYACAFYYRGECYWEADDYLQAENNARNGLDILDKMLLSENSFIPNFKGIQTAVCEKWLPGQIVILDAVWLRRSSFEDLVKRRNPFFCFSDVIIDRKMFEEP